MVEVVMVELLDERTDLVPLAAAELHLADGGRGDERSGEESGEDTRRSQASPSS